jgi:hypothetical protein
LINKPFQFDIDKILKKSQLIFLASLNNYTSGQKFLLSLFDNHPDILTNPFSLQNLISEQELCINDKKIILKNLEKKKYLFNSNFIKIDSIGLLGDNRSKNLTINKKLFFLYLNKFLDTNKWSVRNYIISVVLSYHLASNNYGFKKINKKHIILSVHDFFFLNKIFPYFPNSQILAIVRNPLSSFLSFQKRMILKSKSKSKYTTVKYFHYFEYFFYFLKIKKKINVIILEQLHRKPRESILKLCHYFRIKFHKNLMKSTFGGLKWWNSSNVYSGFKKDVDFKMLNYDINFKFILFNTFKFHNFFKYYNKKEIFTYHVPLSKIFHYYKELILASFNLKYFLNIFHDIFIANTKILKNIKKIDSATDFKNIIFIVNPCK